MLTNCNQLSINRLKTAGNEFKKHTALLVEMKRDLDYIFKRIRIVKNKLSQQYPQAFNGKFNGILRIDRIIICIMRIMVCLWLSNFNLIPFLQM